MATITSRDDGAPVEFATARTYEDAGRTFVEQSDALALVRRIAAKRKELLDRLAEQ
ncbi:hypothetical protein [Arthrobacter sp. D5-1]|uniref:hypothetical protein n=1 Tax=Arthrobacter sp. D5-1 TaxID=1477518 RepID=UPI001A9942F5|nr:hypothetical protein [Arthrobacter sp. D5-1]